MRILSIVGARPQSIRAVRVSGALRRVGDEALVHTGQHYAREFSTVSFEELNIRHYVLSGHAHTLP